MPFGKIKKKAKIQGVTNYVRDYVMGGDSITFCEFVSRLRHFKVEPIAGEAVNAEGI